MYGVCSVAGVALEHVAVGWAGLPLLLLLLLLPLLLLLLLLLLCWLL